MSHLSPNPAAAPVGQTARILANMGPRALPSSLALLSLLLSLKPVACCGSPGCGTGAWLPSASAAAGIASSAAEPVCVAAAPACPPGIPLMGLQKPTGPRSTME